MTQRIEIEERVVHMDDVCEDVCKELSSALKKFRRPQVSPHEGFAVLKEEVDELWDEVKGKHPERTRRMRDEAIQVAAMAIRFVIEVCDEVTE